MFDAPVSFTNLNQKSKLRFAPSPTGFLHVGGARTALFNYLLTKSVGGQFVLRIEDTDTERNRPEFEEEILKSLQWLGIQWDEGPFYQSKRFDAYRKFISDLVAKGSAYRCYCTETEVDEMRKKAESLGQKPMYDRRCRNLKSGERTGPFCVRIKSPLEGEILIDDAIKGEVRVAASELDDFVILRTNDTPTYNLTVVVDDFEMGITHVVRGEEHLNNTPKQLILFRAAGFTPPQYAHIPLILAPDKTKLSKRHGAVAVSQFKEEGYLAEALVNYLAKLGWSHGNDEIFTAQELIKIFSMEGFGKSGSVFDKTKLDWFNAHYLKKLSVSELCLKVKEITKVDLTALTQKPGGQKLLEAVRDRAHRINEIPPQLSWALLADGQMPTRDPEAEKTILSVANKDFILKFLYKLTELEKSGKWNSVEIAASIKIHCQEFNLKMPDLAKPLRVLLTGSPMSPDISLVLEVLGLRAIRERISNFYR